MANTVSKQKIMDGDKNVVILARLISDGASGDETDTAIVDVSTLNSDQYGKAVDHVSIDKLYVTTDGCDVVLEWDASTDDEIARVGEGGELDWNFEAIGGLPNPKSSSYTGDITITTNGFSASGDEITVYLECNKHY